MKPSPSAYFACWLLGVAAVTFAVIKPFLAMTRY